MRGLGTNSLRLDLSPLRIILGELLFTPYNIKKYFIFLPLREEQANKLFLNVGGLQTFTSYYADQQCSQWFQKVPDIQQMVMCSF